MGEVYRAKDSKLGRDVAIKILSDEFAGDAERLARFEREARLLAQLNHENIATLHGLEEHEGQQCLVMELIDGGTLAEKIAEGPIPVDEAVRIFVQIAEGLEAAHEKGIIHRDLKPANIKLTPGGKIKVLDFGLAKASSAVEDVSAETSQSPTLTKGTALGVIMGTAPYMSPEQARGKTVDQRTDIWAYGCCLYEALAGKRAFAAETVTDTLAKIIEREPDWDALPDTVPRATRSLLDRCLRKRKEERLGSAGDIALRLQDTDTDAAFESPSSTEPRQRRSRGASLTPAAIAAAAGLLAGYLLSQNTPGNAPVAEPSHWAVPLPPDATLHENGISLSPDGKLLVAALEIEGRLKLYGKNVDSAVLEPIPGTEGGYAPFFSPDGEWIGFFGREQVHKIRVSGGNAIALCDYSRDRQRATWGPDGMIVYTGRYGAGLASCPSDGGEPQVHTQNRQFGESAHRSPTFLPDGSILFAATGGIPEPRLAVLRANSDDVSPIPIDGHSPSYVTSGYLVYQNGERLLAATFDATKPARVGRETILADGLYSAGLTFPSYALSKEGTLAFIPGNEVFDQLIWVDREGRAIREIGEPGRHMYPRLSPQGDRALVSLQARSGDPRDIWLYDIERGSRAPLTFDKNAYTAEWSRDGQRVAFMSYDGPAGETLFYSVFVDQEVEPELLLRAAPGDPVSWSPDGRTLLYNQMLPEGSDVWEFDIDGARDPRPLLGESYDEHTATFSPDGQWIAYTSGESGRTEVYVQPYPGPGRKYSVSTSGGNEPVWSRDGRELFFRDVSAMMVVDVSFEPEFQASAPRELFRGSFRPAPAVNPNYDVSADGEHFLMVRPTADTPREIHVIVNWAQQLDRLVPEN